MMDLEQIKRANANPKAFARSRLSDYEAAREDEDQPQKKGPTRAK